MNCRQESDVKFEDETKEKIESALKDTNKKVVFAFFGKPKYRYPEDEIEAPALVGFLVF